MHLVKVKHKSLFASLHVLFLVLDNTANIQTRSC